MGDYDLKPKNHEVEIDLGEEALFDDEDFGDFEENTFDSIDDSELEMELDEAESEAEDNVFESEGGDDEDVLGEVGELEISFDDDIEAEDDMEQADNIEIESDEGFAGFDDITDDESDFILHNEDTQSDIELEQPTEDDMPEVSFDDDEGFNVNEGFDSNTEDTSVKSDISDYSDEELSNMSLEELERLLQSQRNADNTDDSDMGVLELPEADDSGSVIDGDTLLSDNLESVSNDRSFISETGEIVVQDTSEIGDNFKIQYIPIENIAVVKRIRSTSTNVEDLAQSIKSTGLLEPLVVTPTSTEGIFVLLAGFRRLLACARLGKTKVPCIINLKANVPEIPVIEAIYNHSKKYTIKEIVEYINYLEQDKGIMSASMIEYLLQMNSGEYTKLKDILNDDDDDIVSKLYDGTYTIEMAFKKLEQRRKKESAEEKENKRAAKVYSDTEESGADAIEGSGDEVEDDVELTEEEMKNFAFNRSDLNNIEDEDEEELLADAKVEGFEPNKQDYKNRERLDPDLRKAVLARDHNTCQICITNGGQEFVDVLDVHHIQEVYLGGDDNIDNLITACTVCHKLIHKFGRGELEIRSLDEFDENERMRFKKIIKLGTVIRKGLAAKGLKREQLKRIDGADSIGRTKPGEGQQTT